MRRIIVITGASSGMGECFSRELAAENAELWLVARRKDRLEKIAEELAKSGAKALAVPLDISGKAGVNAFKEFLQTENAKSALEISWLVNNAGFGTYGTFEATPLDVQLDMVELNCTAMTGICGVCLPFMKSGSKIVNTASLASFLPLGNFAVYGATKSFVLSFSFALAAELKDRGISVTALCPGPVSTEFAAVASAGARKEVLHGKDASKVVSHCIKCVRQGKKTAIFAPKWKITALLSHIVPRSLGAWFTYRFCPRPRNNAQ